MREKDDEGRNETLSLFVFAGAVALCYLVGCGLIALVHYVAR